MRACLGVALCALLLRAADPELEAIRADLNRARAEPRREPPLRGSKWLISGKHRLRDWIASKLPAPGADWTAAAAKLNGELNAAGLFDGCGDCDDQDYTGSLTEVRVQAVPGFPDDVLVHTAVGFPCGFDGSAYLLQRRNGAWRVRFATERNGYETLDYRPQTGVAVTVARDPARGDLVLTRGFNPACLSMWQSYYLRLFRIDRATGRQRLLWEEELFAYLGHDSELPVSLTRDGFSVRIFIASMDPAVHSREKVLTFALDGDRPRRVEPLALSPRGFIEEWLSLPWEEARLWAAPELEREHRGFRGPREYWEFLSDGCRLPGGRFTIGQEGSKEEMGRRYFLVRETAPQRYLMERVSRTPIARCPE